MATIIELVQAVEHVESLLIALKNTMPEIRTHRMLGRPAETDPIGIIINFEHTACDHGLVLKHRNSLAERIVEQINASMRPIMDRIIDDVRATLTKRKEELDQYVRDAAALPATQSTPAEKPAQPKRRSRPKRPAKKAPAKRRAKR